MAQELGSSHDDLDKTDRLPILDAAQFGTDFEDDAVRMDHTAVLPPNSFFPASGGSPADFVRPGAVDLPSLAESVRSVEERIARQSAEYEALTRSYERVREAESASAARANALAADLAAARGALETEQKRSKEIDKALAERIASTETARSRAEDALRESERSQTEARTLRDSLAARDATIVQVLHSLGERDAQLAALQLEHSKMVPVLEATSRSGSQMEAELRAARAQASAVASELKAGQDALASLHAQLKRGEIEADAARSELGSVKTQAISYLERLRSREWRSGFDLNLFREMDAAQGEAAGRLQAEAAAAAAALARQSEESTRAEETRARLAAQLATADGEVVRLNGELAARDRALADARAAGSGDAKRMSELLAAAERQRAEHDDLVAKMRAEHNELIAMVRADHSDLIAQMRADHAAEIANLSAELAARAVQTQAEQAARIAELQAQEETREQEMAVLMAHLQEARRPIQTIEADVKRLTEELAAKTAAFDGLTEEHQKLRTALERTRGALEEREFLIRRLERSESNNANVLGRIQTSIERLGSPPAPTGAAPAADWSAELVRVDGERPVTYVLARRTRIGRALGCELQIDSSSVSRHHALMLVGARDCIIEDLNSTNGVLVNGRKISRQLLHDGDAVTIGDIQFKYSARPVVQPTELRPAEARPTAGTPALEPPSSGF